MSRRQKRRRPRGQGAGVGKSKRPGGQVDHTLRTLLCNYLALGSGHTVPLPSGECLVSADAHLYLTAIRDHVGTGPEGRARFERALRSLGPNP